MASTYPTEYSEQEVLNSIYDETNNKLNVNSGVEYNATPPTLADGGVDVVQADINGNTKTTLATSLSYSIDSITSYPAGCEVTTVDLATDADVVVTSSQAKLLGVYVLVGMSAHAAIVKDSTTAKITLPASTAANTNIPCYGAAFASNITVESDNSGTGTLLVFWIAAQ